MEELFKNGYTAKKRPSGHDISDKFSLDNGGSILPNLLAIPNTESNSSYIRYCKEKGLSPHPARFPSELPEYFIRMLTDKNDTVLDPFAGSCVTGEVCERLNRKWICCEMVEEYLRGAIGRFTANMLSVERENIAYGIIKPGAMWGKETEGKLSEDGGKARPSNSFMVLFVFYTSS